MESSSLDVGLLCARHLLHWAEEETLFVANANLALHPVNSKQVWPGVEQSEESVEKQGREQSLAASTQEGPQ